MIFAISDIHGHFGLMETRVNQIKPYLREDNNKLILLGDYIDRGKSSFQCLKAALLSTLLYIASNADSWSRTRVISRTPENSNARVMSIAL